MKVPRYYLALTDYEHRVILQSLYEKKNNLLREDKTTDALDEIILKVGRAPIKNMKVVERGGYASAR